MGYSVREARPDDAAVVAEFRLAMSRDAGFLTDEDDVESLREATVVYLGETLASGEFRCWLAECDGLPVSSAAVLLRRQPPNRRDLRGREAYVLNVYTLPEHRRSGLATRLTEHVLAWCESEDLKKIVLHATEDGARIYERFGFRAEEREMVLRRE
jgi:ribosomal protein S18 acetylase RimI-like enzyme